MVAVLSWPVGLLNLVLVLSLTSAGCRNDAITYAHGIAPEAECKSVGTPRSGDVAVCKFDGWVWLCEAGYETKCTQVRRIPAEVKP